MTIKKHTQCKLTKDGMTQVSWIPSEIAFKGLFVRLKNEKKEWEDGWLVKEVYTTLPTETVLERSQDYKKTRKASDI